MTGTLLAPAALAAPPATPANLPAGDRGAAAVRRAAVLRPGGQAGCARLRQPAAQHLHGHQQPRHRPRLRHRRAERAQGGPRLGLGRELQQRHAPGATSTRSSTGCSRPTARGNKAAMARRLGLMYIIWNNQIWKAYQLDRGWQAYNGSDPHTGHVHFSFGWAGAQPGDVLLDRQGRADRLRPERAAEDRADHPGDHAGQPAGHRAVRQHHVADRLDRRSAVKVVQTALRITADGTYGASTKTAVDGLPERPADGASTASSGRWSGRRCSRSRSARSARSSWPTPRSARRC